MSEQPNNESQQNLSISGDASLEETQIGGIAGRDLDVSQINSKIVVNVNVYDSINASRGFIEQSVAPTQPLNEQQQRQRRVLLNKVNNFWIKGFLENSLYLQALIELGLATRLDLVQRRCSEASEFYEGARQLVPAGTRPTDVFEQMGAGRTLLILGEPGSGKTVTLLKMTRSLIERTWQNLRLPIPVVLNLSSWARKRQSIPEWLVQELKVSYQVSSDLGKEWIEAQQLILLLDGLDEVKAEYRNECVQRLNAFIDHYTLTEMVVCCRFQEYEELSERLGLQSALCLQSLTPEQVHQYLELSGEKLVALRTLLQQDAELQNLARSPLILNIMSLAYTERSVDELPSLENVEARMNHLLSAYLERMFQRRWNHQEYPVDQTKRWLSWLAQQMREESQPVFFIENMQPSWLPGAAYKTVYYASIRLIIGIILGVDSGIYLIYFSSFHVNGWSPDRIAELLLVGFWAGLFLGINCEVFDLFIRNKHIKILMPGCIFSLTLTLLLKLFNWQPLQLFPPLGVVFSALGSVFQNFISEEIKSVGMMIFDVYTILKGFGMGAIIGVVYVLMKAGIYNILDQPYSVGYRVYDLLLFTIVGGVLGEFRMPRKAISKKKVTPNQGIVESAKYAFRSFFIVLPSVVLTAWVVDRPDNPVYLLCVGLALGILAWLGTGTGAGIAVIQHCILRLMLCWRKYIPWNYAHLLDATSESLLMKKVGGGYIFYHRMMMDFFAQMEFESE